MTTINLNSQCARRSLRKRLRARYGDNCIWCGKPMLFGIPGLNPLTASIGSSNGKAKLSEEDVAYIRTNPDGLSGRNLALRFCVSPATISLIRSGRRWGHYEAPPEWTGEAA